MGLGIFASIATFLPAIGMFGLALYQAINLHDWPSAIRSVMEALGLGGVGTFLHLNNQAVHEAIALPPPPGPPK